MTRRRTAPIIFLSVRGASVFSARFIPELITKVFAAPQKLLKNCAAIGADIVLAGELYAVVSLVRNRAGKLHDAISYGISATGTLLRRPGSVQVITAYRALTGIIL